jgi:hypothetical protein
LVVALSHIRAEASSSRSGAGALSGGCDPNVGVHQGFKIDEKALYFRNLTAGSPENLILTMKQSLAFPSSSIDTNWAENLKRGRSSGTNVRCGRRSLRIGRRIVSI